MARPARTAAVAKPAKSPAKKPAVAKVKKAATSAAPKKIRSHPSYYEMIVEAIAALKERTGSSVIAIAKHVEDKQGKNLPENFKKHLSNQLKKSVASGKLTKVKNSYKLSAPAKPTSGAGDKKVVKKPAEKKETLKRKRAPADGEKKPVKKAEAAAVKKSSAVKKAAVAVKKSVAAKKSPAKKVVKPKTKSIKSPAGKKMKK